MEILTDVLWNVYSWCDRCVFSPIFRMLSNKEFHDPHIYNILIVTLADVYKLFKKIKATKEKLQESHLHFGFSFFQSDFKKQIVM